MSRLEETGGAPGYAPAAPGNEEEYNLEDNPEGNGNANANAEKQGEDEDYNIGEGGLDEFMTSLKQERKSEAPAPYATVVKRAPEEAKARKTAAPRPVPVASRAVENDNEIMGFAQGGAPPAKPKQKADEFEQLFGDIPAEQRAPAAQVTRPPDTRKPAPPSSSYDQFAAYYTTYQQPVAKPPASSYQPSNPAGYGQQSPAQAGPNAFDDVASKYSRPNPGADGAGEFWQ